MLSVQFNFGAHFQAYHAGHTEHCEGDINLSSDRVMDWTHTIGNVKHVNRPDTANAKFVIGRYSNGISFLIARNSGSVVNFDNSVVC